VAGETGPADLDAVADELYGLPPAEFTAARNRYAQAAKKAGDRALADQIAALRKPTVSAWAGNLLARERQDEVGPLLQLGEALRRAHRKLDGEQLRQLNRQQRELVYALSRQAKQLAAQAGQPLSDQTVREVEETLHAVLADPEAGEAFAEGRLTKPLSVTVDLTGLPTTATGKTRPRPAPVRDLPRRPAKKKPARGRAAEQAAEAARDEERARREAELQRRREEAELQRRREEVEQAERQAREAEEEAQARDEDAAAAQEDLDAADRERDAAQARLDELREQVKGAEKAVREARESQDQARRRLREADRAARGARRHAQQVAAHADQLADRLDQDF
jgi:DNA repair exonuclease SbcCD ATPase subunit